MEIRTEKYNGAKVIVTRIPKNEIEKIDLDVCQQPRETLKHYYDRQKTKPNVIINAGFFNMSDGKPIFDTADEGQVIKNNPYMDIGMGIQGMNSLVYGSLSQYCWRDFVAAYPPLIENGRSIKSELGKELDYKARRTAIGYNDTDIYILSVDTGGLRYGDLQKMFMDKNVKFAINLDGGGSTEILVDGKKKTTNSHSRPVDTVLSFYLKHNEKTLYCVQLGAFSKKENANSMLNSVRKIQSDLIDYTKAYVTFTSPYYKVQVGAFSNVNNAKKVVEDLKKHGYNAFVQKKELSK